MATLRDVAKASGVSTATVSHVLNGKNSRVSGATRERVLAAVRDLRYRPTALEDRQKAMLTRNLGIMVGNLTKNPLSHGYFIQALNGVLEAAAFKGFTVQIFVEKMWDEFGHNVRRSYDGKCDGLIYVAPDLCSEVIVSLQARGTPLVQIGTTAWLPSVASVDIDNIEVGRQAARHLLELGHRRFAFFGATANHASSIEREKGFHQVLLEERPVGLVHRVYGHAARGTDTLGALDEMMRLPINERPTAVFGWHDTAALEIMLELRRRGLCIPEDMSIIGVNNDPEAKDNELTTFENPIYVLGKRAANLLIEHSVDHTLPNEVVHFPITLVKRASTGPVPSFSSQSTSLIGSNGGSK
jgi:DNA-binding LacI/PurR family transcriptional regulator